MVISRYSQHLFVHETNLWRRGAADPCSSGWAASLETLWSSKASSQLLHIALFQLPLMMNVSCVVLCSEGHVAVQRYGCLVVPTSIPQTLVLFNVSAAQRSLLMDPLIPPFLQETCEAHTSNCGKAVCVCVCVCVVVYVCAVRACQVILSPWSSQSHRTLNSYLLPSN